MVITVLMNQSMMIEGKVRESIYIVQNTCRRHEAHQYDRTASSEEHALKIVVTRSNGAAKTK